MKMKAAFATFSAQRRTSTNCLFHAVKVVVVLLPFYLSCCNHSSTAEENVATAVTKVINYAPILSVDPSLCREKVLLGRPHQGGWFVCIDDIPKENTRQRCIIYSYGLGATW